MVHYEQYNKQQMVVSLQYQERIMREGSQSEKKWVASRESVSIRPKIPSVIIYEILASLGKQNKGHSIFEGHKT